MCRWIHVVNLKHSVLLMVQHWVKNARDLDYSTGSLVFAVYSGTSNKYGSTVYIGIAMGGPAL